MAKKNLSTGNFGVGTSWTPTVVNPAVQEWANKENTDWRLTPAARSKVVGGATKSTAINRKPESSEEYTKRRVKEETKRTWRSDVADTLHGIGEGALALHPYTAIPYFGAKVGQDILNGNVNWSTALNASIPLFHLTPQAVGLREATNVALEDAANAGSKTARNWRIAREINLATRNEPKLSNRTISVKRSNNEITGQPDLVYTLYNEFGEPIGLTNIGGAVFGSGNKTHRMVDGVMSMRNAHKVSEDTYNAAVQDIIDNGGKGLESGWSLMMPLKTLAVTSKFPHTVIGLEFGNPVRLLTGTSKRSIPQKVLGNHYLELKPSFEIKYNESTGNFERIPIVNLEPYVSTSLKFFERKPSRISEAEKLGVPKGERNLPFKEKQLTRHVQGEEAVKMFKEYGGEPIPEGSINGELLRKYVAEARERYGLTNNKNITDEEIAQALYKHSKELGGNTAAVNSQGEPQLLFRGDTRRYTLLKERMSPEELAKKSGTMDNSLGNLFLGEFPDSYRGVDRYIGTWRNFNGSPKLVGSGTGSKVVWDGKTASEIEGYPYLGPLAGGGYKLYSQPHRYGNIDVYKLPASMMESGVNDLNAFIVRTPQMRNASSEISVLNDDWMLQGAKDSHFMSKNYKYNPKTYSMENVKTGESLGEITTESAPESRIAMGDHYKELLKEAEQKQLGLLKSEANSPLRDEHSLYSYFALPNFNIQGAKHLLPYDLRIPRNWKDKNIYRGLIPLTTGYTLYNIFNQPQLQYLKQGGKMNTLLFLKNGSKIHIKKKNRGKFTDYCGGKVTNACIKKAKASGNPTLVKRATFAANARKWKHQKGGTLQNGAEFGGLVGEAVKRITKANAAKQWFESRYLPINWNNMKYIYNQMKLAGIPYDTTIAVMGNIIHESQGNPNKRQMGGGPGYGLIQWNKGTEPGDTLELQTQGIINTLTNPSGLNNYWYYGGEGSGFKSGEDVRLYMNQKNNYEFSRKTKAFSDSLLRPGKPEMNDRIKTARSLAALQDQFPEYLKGGII